MKFHSVRRIFFTLLLVGAGCTATPSDATPIVIQPIGATASSAYSATRAPVHTINDSGLSAALPTGSAIPGVWPTHNNIPDNFMWHSAINDLPVSITFDLGAVYNHLEGFHVWNFNENSGNPAVYTLRGFRDVTVSFSSVSAVGPFTNPISYTGATEFIKADGTNTWIGEDKMFGDLQSARWIKFDGLTRWGGTPDLVGGVYTGLSEVRFFTGNPPPAPEPTSWVMLSVGVLGLLRHSRRRHKEQLVSKANSPILT